MVDSARVIDVPVLDDDPFDPAVLVDPYAFYERMREAGPVVFLQRYGVWAFARHAEVAEALGDWETYSSAAGVGLADFRKEAPWRPPSLLLEADPPAHSVVRKPMLHLMTPKVANTLRPAFSAAAEELVETLVSRGEFDGVTDLAEVYPIHVFADAIGLPEDGRHHLLPYAAVTFNAFGPANALRDEAFAGSGPVIEWATAACQRDALFCLATNPDQYELLHAEPKLAKPAFEEAMRLESPLQAFFRTTSRSVDVGGSEIPADAKVLVFFGSANRDPLRWGEHADRYDIHHRAAGHVAFGAGVHVCIGQFIARLEGELVLSALARRAASLRLTSDPIPKPNNNLKAFRHLPLRITAGGA